MGAAVSTVSLLPCVSDSVWVCVLCMCAMCIILSLCFITVSAVVNATQVVLSFCDEVETFMGVSALLLPLLSLLGTNMIFKPCK